MNLLSRCIRTVAAAVACTLLLTTSVLASTDDLETSRTLHEGKASIGYWGVSSTDEHVRALEYSLLDAGPTLGLEFQASKEQRHFNLDSEYLNDADYFADVHLDYKGLLRLELRTESLYHNLEHIPYDPPFRNPATHPKVNITFEDQNPGDDYHVEVGRSSAKLRAKVPDMPAHINLSYWRLERSGKKQLRFLEESVDANCNTCHMQSKTRDLDRVTEEVTAGVDAHLGPVEVIFEQLYRQFREKEPIPTDFFGAHGLRLPGDYQHDEVPDSRLIQSTLKAHTSLAGGLVGTATFSLGKRENQSDLTDVYPVESETDFRKAVGDVTYILRPELTFNFRYRMLDLDNSNTNQLKVAGLKELTAVVERPYPLDVRDNVDLTRASYEAIVSYRPNRHFTLKGNFEREEIHRGNTGGFEEFNALGDFIPPDPIEIDPVWELPEDENINRFRLSFYARPLENSNLRMNGWYQYRTSDDPAYGNSAEKGHEVFLSGTWSPSQRWGTNANIKLISQVNNEHEIVVSNDLTYDLDRDRESGNLTAGIWFNPTDSLNLNFNYGYFRTRTEQDLLFGDSIGAGANEDYATENEDVEYSQRVHTTSVSANWRLLENLTASAEARYIDSFSSFDPDFAPKQLNFGGPVPETIDPSELEELSEVDIRQTGMRIALFWSPDEVWTLTAQYTFDDYEDRNSSIFDGSAETYLASVSRVW